MADRSKKESTPPPLLLMPAGGGLTLTPPEQPNFLMPVVQSGPALLDPGEEAEADSFVGQSSPPQGQPLPGQPTNYFQSSGSPGYDPFAQVGPGQPPVSTSAAPYVPAQISAPASNMLPPMSQSPIPPSAAVPPPSQSPAGGGNIYRQKGSRLQYAPPPTGLGAPTLPPSTFAQLPPSGGPQPPTAMVPPMTSSAMPPFPPTAQGPPPPTAAVPPMSGAGPSPAVGQDASAYTGGLYYTPVRHHWCFRQDQGEVEVWRPFSVIDSSRLEMAFSTGLQENPSNTMVLTNGGRYDVNVGSRVRTPVYWTEEPKAVKRCSWFYKREGDNRYIPYEEEFSTRLEDEYRKAMETGGWHRRLEFPGNIIIVMHNANVIVQFPASAMPDEWGNVQSQNIYSMTGDQMRPRVVKRGVDDFATIEYGEREEVDHLVFFVPGIEDMSDVKGKSVEAFVDDFRSNTLNLMQSHFTQAFQAKSVNRVEFLPVVWTQALNNGASGAKEQVGSVTLPSTSKLRHFINNTLVDTLFYTSPLYCQRVCETVGSEMNRMFHIFLERNQSFSGDVSVAGHSLGSVILFDLLINQRLPGESQLAPTDLVAPSDVVPDVSAVSQALNGDVSATEDKEEEELTLEALLSRVGLQDKATLFQEEQMDVESLIMCSEQDLKDIGLPMGPRKKLLGLLKEEQERKQTSQKEKAERKMKEEIERKQAELRIAAEAAKSVSLANEGNQVTAKYIQGHYGAGQLKVSYPQLDFTPSALFALGSPIPVFLSLRGVQEIGEFFQLPTCPRVYNIFHPFDPMAYRMEPLIRSNTSTVKPVQVPHYKGRKRLHLEFKEAVTRYGTDIKQKLIDSFKSTWNSINDFAKAHTTGGKATTMENEVQSGMKEMMSHIAQQHSEDDKASVSSMAEEEIHMGQLNEGQRVDYVLQEGPLESFNDYLFALASHSCYWESEDTALLVLREIYSPLGIRPQMPGEDSGKSSRESSLPPRHPAGPPPPSTPKAGLPPAPSAFQTPPHSSFQPPLMPFQNNGLQPGGPNPGSAFHTPSPMQPPPAGPPPTMFSPMGTPPTAGPGGMRKSPYVAPDFSNLPSNMGASPTGPPPMGPAAAGGYRRMPPPQ
ncbi:phospholipase DDHD2 isoform X2 [Aplysia californica]|uniref:Phospholipase DDHD2 isoform X2 n=1 Tax=Aplysia californica TaxID=6500 RepID=A0ABM0JNA3_APLCA|nr:phospholipase DDHD2 isoform X2 [Aplysia californica]